MSVAGDGPMTLLLTISAVRRLADPGAAIAEAKRWSEHVGVVADDMESVESTRSFVDGIGADPDLVAGQVGGSLSHLRQRLRTDRHVLVGTTEEQERLAPALGWEFKPVEAAAEAAGWSLRDDAAP